MGSSIATISREDTAVLLWFFGEGLCAFERSTHASLMARASNNGGHVDCPMCEGTRWIKVRVAECADCKDGYQYQAARARPRDNDSGEPFATVARAPVKCTSCHGRRVVELEPTCRKKAFTVDEICPQCSGLGVVGVDGHKLLVSDGGNPAFPRGFEVRSPPPDPDDQSLRWYGLVMRRLMHMRKKDVAVLYAEYGIGPSFERQQSLGRVWPVLALTQQGKRLLERYKERRPKQLPAKAEEPYNKTYGHEHKWGHLNAPQQLAELVGMPSKAIDGRVWQAARDAAQKLKVEAAEGWNIAALRSATASETASETARRRRPRGKPKTKQAVRLEVTEAKLLYSRRVLRHMRRA